MGATPKKLSTSRSGAFEFSGFGMKYQQVKWSAGTTPRSMRFEALGPSNHCLPLPHNRNSRHAAQGLCPCTERSDAKQPGYSGIRAASRTYTEPCIEVRPCRDPSKGLRRFSAPFAATVSHFATPSPNLTGYTETVHPPEGSSETRLPGDAREGNGYRISPQPRIWASRFASLPGDDG